MSSHPTAYALDHVPGLHPYVPGLQPDGEGWIKLNTNECPYPPSPKVEAAIKGELDNLTKYPNPQSLPLRAALARKHNLSIEQVIVGNGSDDILNMLVRVFCGGDKAAAMTLPSYSLYPVLTAIQNGQIFEIPFDREMELPVDDIAISQANIFFLTAPNAPTGVTFAEHEIRSILDRFQGVFVIDEAYADFADHDFVHLLSRYPNLVITRTFSKSHGLAGLRVGYAMSSPQIIELLDRVRDSYNVSRLSQAGALAAVNDPLYYKAIIQKIRNTRDYYLAQFVRMGWFTYRSHANFIFTEPRNANGDAGPAVAEALYRYLLENRILVRYFGSSPLTAPFLRISVGDETQMHTLLEVIDSWLKNA